jgi:hypothetical protein
VDLEFKIVCCVEKLRESQSENRKEFKINKKTKTQMKMEVLSVQSQFQGQFGVIGATKVKDWTSPLTKPTSQEPSITSPSQEDALQALSLRLQSELRLAKSKHLSCTEVLLPADLLHRVASEMIKMSEKEPCGIRGCSLFIEFEDEPSNSRRIASIKVDPNTVSTFELYLTLKQDRSGWTSILPQFLKNLARGSTIMISPEYALIKNKLYRSFSE